jgi:hypothetical protein
VTTTSITVILGLLQTLEQEVLMQRRRRAALETQQGNLFHPQRERPAWKTLPAEARNELTRLVARMLNEHQRRDVEQEVEHE